MVVAEATPAVLAVTEPPPRLAAPACRLPVAVWPGVLVCSWVEEVPVAGVPGLPVACGAREGSGEAEC